MRGTESGSGSGAPLMLRLVRLAGLVATIYLVVCASLLLVYATSLATGSSQFLSWENAGFIVICALPLLLVVAIGFAGLRFWPHGRFPRLGLSALALQIAMAVWLVGNPVRLIAALSGGDGP